MMEFRVEFEEGYDDPYFVKSDDGWFFPVATEKQAKNLCDSLNAKFNSKRVTIEDYYNEWDKAITELSEKEADLSLIKEEYSEKEFDIVFINSEGVDFKDLYGSTSEKVRKNHIKKELKSLEDAKNDLNVSIDYLKRRIDFIKSIMAMQRTLINSGVLE